MVAQSFDPFRPFQIHFFLQFLRNDYNFRFPKSWGVLPNHPLKLFGFSMNKHHPAIGDPGIPLSFRSQISISEDFSGDFSRSIYSTRNEYGSGQQPPHPPRHSWNFIRRVWLSSCLLKADGHDVSTENLGSSDEGHEMTVKWQSGWWFGCHFLNFPIHIGNLIIPIDELIFFRGVAFHHQPDHVS